MNILKLRHDFGDIIQEYEILDYKKWQIGFYFKSKASLRDGSFLYIREYVDEDDKKYAYHWQRANGELIARWDNAPHHPQLSTFPHHKHEGGSPDASKESKEVSVVEVLTYIRQKTADSGGSANFL